MGKKKKRAASKVWCYYCEREFDDEKIPVQHQNAKHFQVPRMPQEALHRRLHGHPRPPGFLMLSPRESQQILNFFGMQGIPPEILQERYGEEEEASTKLAKVEMPATGVVRGMVPRPFGIGFPPLPAYAAVPPLKWRA